MLLSVLLLLVRLLLLFRLFSLVLAVLSASVLRFLPPYLFFRYRAHELRLSSSVPGPGYSREIKD